MEIPLNSSFEEKFETLESFIEGNEDEFVNFFNDLFDSSSQILPEQMNRLIKLLDQFTSNSENHIENIKEIISSIKFTEQNLPIFTYFITQSKYKENLFFFILEKSDFDPSLLMKIDFILSDKFIENIFNKIEFYQATLLSLSQNNSNNSSSSNSSISLENTISLSPSLSTSNNVQMPIRNLSSSSLRNASRNSLNSLSTSVNLNTSLKETNISANELHRCIEVLLRILVVKKTSSSEEIFRNYLDQIQDIILSEENNMKTVKCCFQLIRKVKDVDIYLKLAESTNEFVANMACDKIFSRCDDKEISTKLVNIFEKGYLTCTSERMQYVIISVLQKYIRDYNKQLEITLILSRYKPLYDLRKFMLHLINNKNFTLSDVVKVFLNVLQNKYDKLDYQADLVNSMRFVLERIVPTSLQSNSRKLQLKCDGNDIVVSSRETCDEYLRRVGKDGVIVAFGDLMKEGTAFEEFGLKDGDEIKIESESKLNYPIYVPQEKHTINMTDFKNQIEEIIKTLPDRHGKSWQKLNELFLKLL